MTDNICILCDIPKKINLKCIHGKQKYFCIECGNITICEHKKRKYRCKDCKGNQVCIHDHDKYTCKVCNGSRICMHHKNKSYCKECNISIRCNHNFIKYRCKVCNGSQLCIHNQLKYICKDCNGSQICIHNKNKLYCKICDGRYLCKSLWCETYKNNKYEGYCVPCFVNNPENKDKPAIRNYKTKENEVVLRIKNTFPDFTWITDKKIEDGCSRRRPDLLLDMGNY